MLGGAFGLAWLITWLLDIGSHSGNKELIIAMPIAIAFDVVYRKSANGHWFHPYRGGHMLFLPVWLWGVVMLAVNALAT